jgi:hypothetical protein
MFMMLFVIVFSPARYARAQGGGGANKQGGTPNASANQSAQSTSSAPAGNATGGGLQGISYPSFYWQSQLILQAVKKNPGPKGISNIVLLCYKLVPGNSAAQPFVLMKWPLVNQLYDEKGNAAGFQPCANVTPTHPLLMNQSLVMAIDMSSVASTERFKILNWNITSSQGTTLNVSPLRPSLAAGTISGPALFAENHPYYLAWPNQLAGDTIPTLTLNLVYTPVSPGLPWQANTFYPAGSIVISSGKTDSITTTNGHYYLATSGGVSNRTQPRFDSAAGKVAIFGDGPGVSWKDVGTSIPAPTPPQWQANHQYALSDKVVPSIPNGHYYEAGTQGIAGPIPPPVFPLDGTTVLDGAGLYWRDMGASVPAAPATPQPWSATTAYGKGAQVLASPSNGHYYQAQTAGVSGPNAPPFPVAGETIAETQNLEWVDVGSAMPSSAKTQKVWLPRTAFFPGDVIQDPSSGHFYSAVQGGISGSISPHFVVPGPLTVTEDTQAQQAQDAEVVWELLDAAKVHAAEAKLPAVICTQTFPQWTSDTTYSHYDCVVDHGRTYVQINAAAGKSGTPKPDFASLVEMPPITWQDVGTSPPSSVSSGQPADITISLAPPPTTLPQVHMLSAFNLASGVVVSSIKNTSFVYVIPPGGTTQVPKKITSGPIVDPVLAMTVYFKTMDAERPWHASDLIPGGTLGFSLTSPGSNFYFGGSSELFKRNLQVMYGFSLAKVSALAPAGTVQGSSATTPPTQQVFAKGAFVGVTFNISGFIQSLF